MIVKLTDSEVKALIKESIEEKLETEFKSVSFSLVSNHPLAISAECLGNEIKEDVDER